MSISSKKKQLGQFFTKQNYWLLPQVKNFIRSKNKKIAYDPFVGNGDLLHAVRKGFGFKKFIGLDIEPKNKWEYNDSLINVPKISDSIIITNPPYLTNYSAKRKKIYAEVEKYFIACSYDDLYQLAIEKCLNNDYGVMIIPETFINSSFPKNRLYSVTILEENPFDDTETPVCIICFDNKSKSLDKIKVYKNNIFLNSLDFFENKRMRPSNLVKIKFNDINGNIALRAVDTTNPLKKISFMRKEELDYDLIGIKHSSRLITVINIPSVEKKLDQFINKSNLILNNHREKTHDVLFSPFKGNCKDGKRRRRLDYLTARAILEISFNEIYQNKLI
jgi:hypothetical protein